MLYGIYVAVVLMASALYITTFVNHQAKEMLRIHDRYSALEKPYTYREHAKEVTVKLIKTSDLPDTLQTIFVRVCRDVVYKARDRGCSNWNREAYAWQFLGDLGTSDTLSNVLSKPSSSTFSCANFENGNYGRYILAQKVKGLRYYSLKYDLTSVTDKGINPCSYDDLVAN